MAPFRITPSVGLLLGITTLACWVGTAMAVLLLVQDAQTVRLAAESTSWPRTMGDMLESSVSRGSEARGMHGATASRCYLHVSYRYIVGNETFWGKRATFADPQNCDADARYVPGTKIAVSYRPGEPGVSVLEPGEGPFEPAFALALEGAMALLACGFAGGTTWLCFQAARTALRARIRTRPQDHR